MIIRELELSNFRNYGGQRVHFSAGVNIITGGNGQGKTNLLEAVYFLSHLRSNRAPRMRDLVLQGQASASVRAVIIDSESRINIRAVLGERGKTVEVNGQRMQSAAKAGGMLKVVMFSPEDLYLVKGEPADRRAFLDETMEEIGPLEASSITRYRHLLRQRNAVLKTWEQPGGGIERLLEPWNRSLAREGARITAARRRMMSEVSPVAAGRYAEIAGTGNDLEVRYAPSFESSGGGAVVEERELYERLRDSLPAEKRAGVTLVGPHRDDVEVTLGGREARHSASQGEQRTAAFCLRLAQKQYIEHQTGKQPVMLLDDVMSELDAARRSGVLRLAADGAQALITTTEEPEPGMTEDGRVLVVEGGRVSDV